MRTSPAKADAELVITSLQNERIKAIRALDMRKERKATGLFVAEGTSVLAMAQARGVIPTTIVRRNDNQDETPKAKDLVRWAKQNGAEILTVAPRVLAKLTKRDNPQSLLGVFHQRIEPISKLSEPLQGDVWIALDSVRDPGNLGTIIRTAEAVSASGIILIGSCCDAYSRECVRATMGSIFSNRLLACSEDEFIQWRKRWPGDVVATHLEGATDFRELEVQRPVVILMGSEGPGLKKELLAVANKVARIPMSGDLDSLNLAVATALMLFEIKRAELT